MANVSPDLLWLLVRKQNKYIYKQGGDSTASVTFTREPFNLTNQHSFKYSGLANKKAVGIEAASAGSDNPAVTLVTKKTRKGSKPSDALHKALLKKDVRTLTKTVINQIVENGYRPDLKRAALARLTAIHKSLRVAKAGSSKKPKSKKVVRK